eukprot:674424-Rhodomonas_salina.2
MKLGWHDSPHGASPARRRGRLSLGHEHHHHRMAPSSLSQPRPRLSQSGSRSEPNLKSEPDSESLAGPGSAQRLRLGMSESRTTRAFASAPHCVGTSEHRFDHCGALHPAPAQDVTSSGESQRRCARGKGPEVGEACVDE